LDIEDAALSTATSIIFWIMDPNQSDKLTEVHCHKLS